MADELTPAEHAEAVENQRKLREAYAKNPEETTKAFFEAMGRKAPDKK